MIILHGENTVQSRARLATSLQVARDQKKNVQRLEAKHLDIALLEMALGNENLFGEEKIVVIEELHSLPKSKRKDELIDFLAASNFPDILLWEKRQLTPTMLKKFPWARADEFKLTNALFKWLDAFQQKNSVSLLDDAIQSDCDFMCLTMLVRQIRLLIQAKTDGNIAGAPFMIAKLKKQASAFSLPQLLQLHHKLLEATKK